MTKTIFSPLGLLAMIMFILVSVNALPRALYTNETPTPIPTRSLASSSMQDGVSGSAMALATTHAAVDAPSPVFEDEKTTGDLTELSASSSSSSSSTTSSSTATPTSLVSVLDVLSTVGGLVQSLTQLLGLA